MARINPGLMQVDGGGAISLSPNYIPEDSAARNAVINAATTTATNAVTSNSTAAQAALIRLTSGATLTDAEKKLLGMSTASTSSSSTDNGSPKWVKSSTVNTVNGPVDVDSNGLAQDGTRPVAVVAKGNETFLTRNGFTPGAFPKGLEQFFGSSSGILGWKIVTNEDGSQQLEVADSENSSKTFGFKFKSDGSGNYTQFNTSGGGGLGGNGGAVVDTTGTTGGPTTAFDVFKQTLSIFFGPSEMGKPWVAELYKSVSKFTKAGSTSEEAFNLAVLDVEKNPSMGEFTKRFKGIYALQKMKQAGQAVTVPTVAEYFATESKMADVLKQSSLGDLANEDFLGDVLSKGVSATEFANRITAIFDRIDNAPKDIKDTLSRFFPTVDRISLAKAIALGDKGAKELQTKVAGYEVLSAAEKQGLGAGQLAGGVTEERAYQYALGGETFDTALTKFGTVAAALPTVNKLTQIYGEPMLGPSGIEEAVFGKSAKQIKAMEDLANREQASFSGRSGVTQASLASQRRGSGLI